MPDRPIPKPKQFLKVLDILNTQGAANMIDPKSYADMVGQYAFKAYKNDELSYRDYLGIVKPLFGKAGEMVTKKIEERDKDLERYATGGRVKYSDGSDEPDISKLREKIIELMDTDNLTFEEAYKEAREEGYAAGGRVGFDEGTPKDFNRNPGGKNQYTANMRDFKTVQEAIKNAPPKIINGKEYPLTKKDLVGQGKYYKNKIVTKNELKRFPKLIIPGEGKPITVEKSKYGKERQKFITAHQGSEINAPKKSGFNFAHFLPKVIGIKDVTSRDTGMTNASLNRSAEGYDKAIKNITTEQKKLIDKKPKGYKYDLTKLNFLAANTSKRFAKDLGSRLNGTLGYYTVNPDTGKFTAKGVDLAKTFAGVSGEPVTFKTDMDKTSRKEYGKTQTTVQSLINMIKNKLPDVKTTRASNLPLPQKTLTANMFKGAFKGLPGNSGEIKDPLGGPDLIDIKKLDKNPYNDI